MNTSHKKINDHIRSVWLGRNLQSVANRNQTAQQNWQAQGQPVKPVIPSINAGAGLNSKPLKRSMNDFIRRETGRL